MLGELLLVLLIAAVCIAMAIVGVIWLVMWVWRGKLSRVVANANLEHGTNFEMSPTAVMGSWTGKALLFDSKNKKLMLYSRGRYTLHDYGYIRRWDLRWIESTGSAGNILHKGIRLVIETNDLNYPVQSFPMSSKSQGDVWHQRLDLLLNG
jgi:hypothetical protein